MKDIVLIPAYQPDENLINVVNELCCNEVGILVVDDGSGSEYKHIFDCISQRAHVLHIPCNAGKGAALKNGMATIWENYPECKFFVTADADGQHKTTDIMRVFDELHNGAEFVLTVRKFDETMPVKSRIGNDLSRYIYTALNNHYLIDNQSGLRGFRKGDIEWLLRVDGSKYDFEINMLYYLDKQNITITTIPIEAIYINNNSASHFNPVKDTLRIYARLFYSARATFISIVVLEPLVFLFSLLFGYSMLHITIPSAFAAASLIKIFINYFIVFRNFKYKEITRTIIYAVVRCMVYILGTYLIGSILPDIPMFVSFNFVAVICVPMEYWFHKAMYFAKFKDVNKER